MTTAVTSPAGRGARRPDTETELPAPGDRTPGRWVRVGAVAVAALVVGSLLVVTDLRARSETTRVDLTLRSADGQLAARRHQLAPVERHLAGARAARVSATRSFDSAQAALKATQSALSSTEAGIRTDGVDLSALDTCLSDVEQALNQLSVGQTTGGLDSLRTSSTACAVLNGSG
jgi:septal ring factor EnvC (AmiA/AmiB activator)